MATKVFFWDLSSSRKVPFDRRLRKLLKSSSWAGHLQPGDLVAVKIHFGEAGATGFVSPHMLKPVLDFLRKAGTKPFLTDTNTLYIGQRGESVSHALQAARHGFDPLLLGAPVIIADGIKSGHEVSVNGPGRHFEHCYLAGDILDADVLVTISHATGHELTGYAGALKNIGMGCATRKGKMQQHCGLGPRVAADKCRGCGECIEVCGTGALWLDEQGRVQIEPDSCTGCAACLLACKSGALDVEYRTEIPLFMERLVEYAGAVLQSLRKPALHLAYLLNVTAGCDCCGFGHRPLCSDIGVLASCDPVALDQAGYDLINAAPEQSKGAGQERLPAEDKFATCSSLADAAYCFAYAQQLGLGEREYQLIAV